MTRSSLPPSKVLGSMLAGAVGDALGSPIEFNSIDDIRDRFGQAGLRDYATEYGGRGKITDDTQMTLFTLEGLIRAHAGKRRGTETDITMVLQHAYQRWYLTQGQPWERWGGVFAQRSPQPDGWLITNRGLFHRRAPGGTCMASLRTFATSGKPSTPDNPINDSKGCGGVMRAAPVAFWSDDPVEVFTIAVRSGALTHGHPSGYLSAGVLAVIVSELLEGTPLPDAVTVAREQLLRWNDHQEQLDILDKAVELSQYKPDPETIAAELGGGWVGEEALAIGLCAALCADDMAEGLLMAVNHSGDSDSTGAICGNILGAAWGIDAIPASWLAELELREVIERLSLDAVVEFGPKPLRDPAWYTRYPDW
ncbi:ADP-ribosylglycohydrolase family protein [Kibdelosporangium philippinense]|uniref:ADP-ribosylglycohydrolase family protein n=1 Tax=Kibdelosporangium philippinense TaxID=211113 RepID=A0ABS8ZE82_9PSEU|nr:ADP-ribosylglycohydrolase family protein [Kibdelosporangium philippinense]MCE7005200.1 ADP-ribosylglycohydrolase family protein [Kibdelosporangium philippinense]